MRQPADTQPCHACGTAIGFRARHGAPMRMPRLMPPLTTRPARIRRRCGRRWRAPWIAMCAWSGAVSPAARPRFTWRSGATRWSSWRRTGLAGAPPGRSGAQAIYGLAAPQSKIKKLVGRRRRPRHLGRHRRSAGPDPRARRQTPHRLRLDPGSHADGDQTAARCGYPRRARGAAGSVSIPQRSLHAARRSPVRVGLRAVPGSVVRQSERAFAPAQLHVGAGCGGRARRRSDI